MRTKRLKVLFAIIELVICFSACAIIEEAQENTKHKVSWHVNAPVQTKSGSPVDTLQLALDCQTNKSLLLVHQIKKNNGEYVLGLSENDAAQLCIPDSLYFWAQECVRVLNGEIE